MIADTQDLQGELAAVHIFMASSIQYSVGSCCVFFLGEVVDVLKSLS